MIRPILTFFVVAACALQSHAEPETSEADPIRTDPRPNVLLIVADDLGIEVGAYGDPVARTPHLDRLSERGVHFETAWVTASSCSPSRSSIHTGLYPHQNGQLGLSHHGYAMTERFPTIASIFGEAGYRTGVVGKYHIEPRSANSWDFVFDLETERGFEALVTKRDVDTMALMAQGFFGATSEAPFFLMVSYVDPHVPFFDQRLGLPAELHDPAATEPFPALGFESDKVRQLTASYYNCVARLDAGIGLLVEKLEASGHAENTLIVFIGDHGAPFSRSKMTNYDHGMRIPFILYWPGIIEGMEPRKEMVSTIDLFPTVVEAAGLEPPENLPGQSLIPVLRGEAGWDREFLFGEHHAHQRHAWFPMRTVRSGRFQLIENLMPNVKRPLPEVDGCPTWRSREDGKPLNENIEAAYATYHQPPRYELYDLDADPNCFVNLADDPAFEEVRQTLLSVLTNWREKTEDPFLEAAFLREQNRIHRAITEEWMESR